MKENTLVLHQQIPFPIFLWPFYYLLIQYKILFKLCWIDLKIKWIIVFVINNSHINVVTLNNHHSFYEFNEIKLITTTLPYVYVYGFFEERLLCADVVAGGLVRAGGRLTVSLSLSLHENRLLSPSSDSWSQLAAAARPLLSCCHYLTNMHCIMN